MQVVRNNERESFSKEKIQEQEMIKLDEQDKREMILEVKNSDIPKPTQEKLIELIERSEKDD